MLIMIYFKEFNLRTIYLRYEKNTITFTVCTMWLQLNSRLKNAVKKRTTGQNDIKIELSILEDWGPV